MTTATIQKVVVRQQIVEPSTIEKLTLKTKLITDEAHALKVTDYKSSDKANLLAGRINKGKKLLDECRKTTTAESRAFVTTINNLFKPITGMCDVALTHLDTERSAFRRAENKRLAEEQAKAAAEEARRQKISMAKGGDGNNIKPVEQPVNKLEARSTDAVRRLPDRDKIQQAINDAAEKLKIKFPLEIAGIEIYAEWKFNIYDPQGLPDEWKKDSFVDR